MIKFIISLFSLTTVSCITSSTNKEKIDNFYERSYSENDIIRLPIIEPFELKNAVFMDENTWYISYPRDYVEELSISGERIPINPSRYVFVTDSLFYIMCPLENDTCFWIYSIPNDYKLGVCSTLEFNKILSEKKYPIPLPLHWHHVSRTWSVFNNTRKLPWDDKITRSLDSLQ